MKTQAPRMKRLLLLLPEHVIRALKARAAMEGVAPRDLVVAWVQSWGDEKT